MEEVNERKITITRQKKFWASVKKFQCYIDDQVVAEIGNGKTITFSISTRRHELVVAIITGNPYIGDQNFRGGFISNKIIIDAGNADKHFYLKVNVSAWSGNGEFTLIPQN